MTKIKRFSLIVALTLTSALLCSAQEQAKEEAADASTTTTAVGTINGQGTAGKIAKFTGPNAVGNSVITENSTRIGINISPTAVLHVNKAQPPALASNGYATATLLQTSGGKGGNTTGTTGQKAGAGASILLTAGNGGDAPAGGTRGNGGNITLQPGLMGNTTGSGDAGLGSNGNVLLVPNGIGRVGIGTNTPSSMLHVVTSSVTAVYGDSTYIGVYGVNESSGIGVYGYSTGGYGVEGQSVTGYAGYFQGKVSVSGNLTANGNVGIGTTTPGAAKLKVQGGDVFIANPNSLIITSPDAKCWQIRVSNAGALFAGSVPCP